MPRERQCNPVRKVRSAASGYLAFVLRVRHFLCSRGHLLKLPQGPGCEMSFIANGRLAERIGSADTPEQVRRPARPSTQQMSVTVDVSLPDFSWGFFAVDTCICIINK